MPNRGEPTKYSVKLAAEICGIISTCTDSLASILASDDRFPDKSNFYRWLQKKPRFRDMYARAKELQLTVIADEILAIADTPVVGMTIVDKGGGKQEKRRGDMIQHRTLQIETRKWLLAKLKRKEFGERDIPDTGTDRLNEIVAAMKAGPMPRGSVNADE